VNGFVGGLAKVAYGAFAMPFQYALSQVMKSLKNNSNEPTDQSRRSGRLDLERHVPALITWINNKYSAETSKIYRKRFEIGIADWRVIGFLGVHGSGTSAQMSDFLGMDKAAVSRSVTMLQERKLICETLRSGRKVILELTPQGEKMFGDVLEIALQGEVQLLQGFSSAEIEILMNLLNRLHDNIHLVSRIDDDER